MKKIAWLVEKWSVIALAAKAAVKIPFGLALLALAGSIVWNWGDVSLADLVALWLAYHGGNFAIGSLSGFVARKPPDDPATRNIPRHSNLSRMR